MRAKLLEEIEMRLPSLRTLNIVAFVAHLIVFGVVLALTILYWDKALFAEITVDWRKHDPTPPGPPGAGDFSTQIYSLGYYRLLPVILPFPLLTAIVHAVVVFAIPARYKRMIENRNNWIRWTEYSVTASFMTWVLMQLCGVTNIFLLLSLGVLGNVALQLQGHLMEVLNSKRPDGTLKSDKDERTSLRRPEPVKINWVPTFSGWAIFLAQWIPIFAYFFAAVASSGAPWFVYATFIGEFFNFVAFGAVQILYYSRVFFKSYAEVEYAYVLLSLSSKTYLALILAIGISAQ